MKKIALGVLATGLLAGPMAANAIPFSFGCLSNNNTTNCATGESQLLVDVTGGVGFVDFRFSNTGPNASSIADIYWDWTGTGFFTAAQGTITDSGSGVSFSFGANPNNLPAGNNANPDFEATIGSDSNPPVQPNGVNPGEWVNFHFVSATPDFQSVINALNSGALRLGLHVQGFANGGSESFVNEGPPPPTSVPEPTVLSLFGLALLGVGFVRRRRSM